MSKLPGVLLALMWISGCDAPADGDAGSEPATDAGLPDAPMSSACEAGSPFRVALPNAVAFTETDVAFDGDDTLVAFLTASNDVMLMRYDAGGTSTLERRFDARPSLDAVTVDVAIGVGTSGYSLGYTLPWNEPAAGFGAELFAVQLDRSGAMLGEVPGVSDLYDERGDAVWARRPQIGWADDRVVAAWLENRSVLAGGMVVRRASLRLERWDAAGTTEGVRVVADLGESTEVWAMRPGAADRPTYVAWAPIDDGGREVFVASITGAGEPVPVVSFETGNSITSLNLFERDGSSWVAWGGASPGEGELRSGALPIAASWGVSASIVDPSGTAPALHLAMNDGSAEVDLPLDAGSYFDLAPIEVELRDGRVRAAVRRREDGGATSIELRDWCVSP